jgi:serine phosphatase RsbU (regulator of sigma subunit)
VSKLLLRIATKFLPGLETMSRRERTFGVADVIGVLYSTPLALAGLVWLITATDLRVLRANWPSMLLILVLLYLFERLDFFIFVEVTPGTYAEWVWSLWSVITWSSVFLFGPNALWITIVWRLIFFVRKWRRANTLDWRWNLLRHLMLYFTTVVFCGLVALTFYERWGGTYPLPGLDFSHVLQGFAATLVWLLLSSVAWVPILAYFASAQEFAWTRQPFITFARFLGITMGWRLLVDPFAVLAAGLYVEHGLVGYLFFVAGLVISGYLAHRLSQAVERSQLRSRELEKLERLGRAIINMPPDAAGLEEILNEHVANMFPYCHIEIRFFPNRTVLHHPEDWPLVEEVVWRWVEAVREGAYFRPGDPLPWDDVLHDRAIVVAPIIDVQKLRAIGGVYLERYRDTDEIARLLPAVQALAAQIASALHSTRVYQQSLALQKVENELALAGQIQASFLPHDLPEIPGWEVTAALMPALETSGDFYDVIPLSNGRWGIVVADVADKGTGAALYMALSRTLIRTYALQYYRRPDYVLKAANKRILMDTASDLFVTVFYGVIDPGSGTLTYANAGHNPPFLLKAGNGEQAELLCRTGMPLGIFEGQEWEQDEIEVAVGDTLVLYTDGLIDAENGAGDYFGSQRLLKHARTLTGRSAYAVEEQLLEEVQEFVGYAPQLDDITLMVLVREGREDKS